MESSHTPRAQFPLLLVTYIRKVHLPQPMKQWRRIITHSVPSFFTLRSVYLLPLSWLRVPPGPDIILSCHVSLGSLGLWQFLRRSLFGVSLRAWGVLVRCCVEFPSIWDCPVFLLWLDVGYGVLVKCHISSHPINDILTQGMRTSYQHDLGLVMWPLIMWLSKSVSGFSVKLLLPPFPCRGEGSHYA